MVKFLRLRILVFVIVMCVLVRAYALCSIALAHRSIRGTMISIAAVACLACTTVRRAVRTHSLGSITSAVVVCTRAGVAVTAVVSQAIATVASGLVCGEGAG